MTGYFGRGRRLALAGSLAAFVVAGTAWAEPAPPFAQLLRETADAPRVTALQADVDRAQGLSQQARARPNPYVSVYAENFGGSSPYGGFGRTETTLQLNQPVEIGGRRSSRIAAGEAGVVAARARNREGRIAYAYDLARAYAAAEIAERRIGIAEDEVEEAEADLKLARALVTSGKEARLRQLQAETELATLQADLEGARAGRVTALARLSALAGKEVPFTSLSESLLDRVSAKPAAGPTDPLQTATYLAAVAEQDAAARRVTAERRRAIPEVTLQVGLRRLDYDNANAIVAGVQMPFPVFDGNKGNIAAAEAESRGARARAAAAQLEAEADVRSAIVLVEAADLKAAAADRAMSTADETYRLARIAYESGKSPLIELLAARHGLGVARGILVDSAAGRLDARAQLARLKGLTITGEPVQ